MLKINCPLTLYLNKIIVFFKENNVLSSYLNVIRSRGVRLMALRACRGAAAPPPPPPPNYNFSNLEVSPPGLTEHPNVSTSHFQANYFK